MKHNFSIYILLCTLFLGSIACQDDLLYKGGEIGEGESLVSATVKFKPLTPALNGNTRAAGDIIKSIKSLCVLMYNEEGRLLKAYPLKYAGEEVTTPSEGEYTLKNMDRSGDKKTESIGGENKELSSAESQTPHADFKLTIPYGRYRIYAVANISDLLTNENYSNAIQTIESLKSISLTWDTETIANNNQMFGYFTVTGSGQSNDLAVINQSKASLHAWIRRAASKVTVAFDGSRLNDNVYIYIQSVTLKDIPRNCFLGKENKVGENLTNPPSQDEKETVLWKDGETFTYSKDADFHNWPAVTAGRRKTLGIEENGKIPSNEVTDERLDIKKYHTENTPALYFYENIQGTGKDKRQDATGSNGNPDGVLDAPGLPGDPGYIEKDDKPYGTYVEVKGYYRAINSEGPITYRFMLGKDVKTDYNAERNHHYKLTLCFNKDANDVDWHIEYQEDKEIIAPDPYYISYLYDQDAVLPIKLKGTDFSNYKLKAEIIENNWKPDTDDDVYWKGTPANDGVWHGFLSLAKTTDKIIGDDKHYKTDGTWNKTYWQTTHPEKGKRTYDLTEGEHPDNFGDYKIEKSESGLIAQIPFYSRAKQMIPTSGYTGNNPYVAYRRKARVKISLVNKETEEEIKDKSTEITIYQVRRCVNPKGIWRSWDNAEDFHVVMKILKSEDATSFSTYHSDGPWRAKVETVSIGDEGFVYIEGAGEDGYIQGRDDTPMDFFVKFKDKCSSPQKVRCAIILVEYNNYTCKHRILVRQGYAPLSLNDSNIKWHTCNMYSKTEETLSPLEEGSMFKFANWDDAILATNNLTYGPREKIADDYEFLLANKESKKWRDIGATKTGTYPISFTEVDVTNVIGATTNPTKVRVASQQDYETLRNEPNREFAYGVLYGDGARETKETLSDVYEYMRNNEQESQRSEKGMRGCFVYNKVTGNNLFFPIGASGNGRRKNDKEWYNNHPSEEGMLQYPFRSELYTEKPTDYNYPTLPYRPLFYDVYRRPGATYWLKDLKSAPNTTTPTYLDINYFTFDFSIGDNECVQGEYGTSACFIRCVEDVPTAD